MSTVSFFVICLCGRTTTRLEPTSHRHSASISTLTLTLELCSRGWLAELRALPCVLRVNLILALNGAESNSANSLQRTR